LRLNTPSFPLKGVFRSLISADAATSLEQTQHQPENKAVSVAPFLGAFKLQKAALVSSYLSVCPHGTSGLPLEGFS